MGGKGAKPQVQTTETTYDPKVIAQWNQMYANSQNIAAQQGQTSGEDYIAGMTDAQNQAGANIAGLAAGGGPGAANAASAANTLQGLTGLQAPQIQAAQAQLNQAGPGAQVAAVDPAQAVLANAQDLVPGGGPATVQGVGVRGPTERLRDVQAGAGAQGMQQYMDPYTNQVIDATTSDIQRAGAEQQVGIEAAAAKAGAFGGSRHGLVEAENLRNINQEIARTSAGLRSQGFQTAAGLSMQDADRALAAGTANQGADISRMQAGTQSRIANAQNLNQANIANMQGQNQYNLGLGNVAANLAQTNAQLGTNVALANMGAAQERNMANAGFGQEANLFNTGQANQMGQFNAGQQNQVGMANAANWLQGQGLSADAAQALGALGINQGNQALANNQALLGFGSMQQGLQQQINAFNYQQPMDLLNFQANILGQKPVNSTNTQTTPQQQGGLFQGLLGLGATVLGGPAGGAIANKILG
jgi:hypothetical protein